MTDLADLIDRMEIQDVLARYCFAIDRPDWELLATVFTNDATFVNDLAGADIQGRSAIETFLERAFLKFVPRRQHLTSASMVTVAGDEATAQTYFTTVMQHDQGTMRTGGTYDDTFVRTSDGWRISKRLVSTIWQEGAPVSVGT